VPEAKRKSGDRRTAARPGSFWSGTIAFGLISIPVSLFVANRGRAVTLRLVDDDGTPLQRRYFCSRDQQALEADDIVRGYQVDSDRYVVVEDEELEALAPEKSREIDLKRFVPLPQIDPVYFDHAYFLAPERGAGKAYRLLAAIMEATQRVGIATFVMRGKEYLVAIIGEQGLLRAETLRFADELRSPADVGLPEIETVKAAALRQVRQAIDAIASDALDRRALSDRQQSRLADLIERKRAKGIDVVAAPQDEAPDEDESAEVIDLMQILKQSLREKPSPRASAGRGGKRGRGRGGALGGRSKDELYTRARELGIPGRSRMSKAELIAAIRAAR
jgi:DNA end-binding protein Ku